LKIYFVCNYTIIKVTIITATYNSGNTIEDTLRSVAAQTYANIEHIIVDGLSFDNTLEIVSRYPHVTIVNSEKDSGIYDAMNRGISLATGDIVAILNSDDFYTSDDAVENMVREMEDEQVMGVYADLEYVGEKDTTKIIRKWKSGLHHGKSFLFGWMPPHPTLFVRRSVYDQCGKFDLSLRSAADYEFMLRAFLKYNLNFKYLPQVLVRMRVGGMSNSSIGNRIKANKEDRQAWKINGLKPYFFTLYLKPLRKILQFIN